MDAFSAVNGKTFDYIVAGGGTSGCIIASILAQQLPDCSVLVVEAGPDDSADPDNLVPGLTKPKFMSKEGNWLYKTAPQTALGGREIIYPRGRGLGGCSANNFLGWVKGPKADWDAWAAMAGDPWWAWDNVKTVFKAMEDFDSRCPAGMEKYVQPTPGVHGKGGPVGVSYGATWLPIVPYCLDAFEQAGYERNLDHNDGDALGYSVVQFSAQDGVRVTSTTAYLNEQRRQALPNLTILTSSLCSRVLFEDTRAVGVEIVLARATTAAEKQQTVTVSSRSDVIVSGGTFQSAQLLLLSGVGPAADLARLDIPVVADLAPVGQHIRDHSAFACEYVIEPSIGGHNEVLRSPAKLAAAKAEYAASKTGPLAIYGVSAAVSFPRLPAVLQSAELGRADTAVQQFLAEPSRPSTEIWLHSGPLFYDGPCPPDANVLAIEGLCQNCLSEGSLTLRSRDPRDLPVVDPHYAEHELDMRVAIETVREILRVAKTPALAGIIRAPLLLPASESEADITTFVRQNLSQGFHSMGSCVMGPKDDPRTVVTSDFRVVGLSGLRVADMSVCPVLTCNHTQVNAYLIGIRCAEVIVADALRAPKLARL
ncbi:glucose-methanol-choline oxidoreductase [Grosmannia clavigera kw1407]|uniref:Glucose-methanol-choline oxidoreductase n=1 Tax=Grosmannia clavigera (strain kw1407 / UAMH 11150) TaxID=655863 RepID=F0XV34_GROCL|nr:glucose-methanol-choline oxidoreductase [Grosmannia clavigera kw1407]EFW98608.1 glucose-methanol-choline oxidoreductase [Grosmannia clavigera kw1407]